MEKIKIVADSKIPFLKGILEPFAEVVYLAPNEITKATVKDADALITRTRTHCGESLLAGSSVKMIATATIGYDHIDAEACRRLGITWKNAPGCNADSVAQYVLSVLSSFAIQNQINLTGKTIGLVGVGNVGKAVQKACHNIGMRVLTCDPPRAREEGDKDFSSMDQIAAEADFISFHTPLTTKGEEATFHLADETFFSQLKIKPLIINAARGGVVDEKALLKAFEKNQIAQMAIDCWENEPEINPTLLTKAFVVTPHIAGYSADGKANATRMAVENIAEFFGFHPDTSTIQAPAIESNLLDANAYAENQLYNLLLSTYEVKEDSRRLLADKQQFEYLRGAYPLRREYKAYAVQNAPIELQSILIALGFKLV